MKKIFKKLIVITNNHETDKINKTEMMRLYKQQFSNKYPSPSILLANLKSNGIKYNCEKEYKGVKGVYTGVI